MLFFELGVVITVKAEKQTAVVFDGWICQARKMIGVKAVAVRLLLLLVTRIIHQEHIRCWGAANHNAVQHMCLMLGLLDIALFFMVEVS